MFRYERPQKGRLRQFHQIGVELLGVAGPLGDIEVIALGAAILDELGLRGNTALELNTLGNVESRAAYRKVLVEYFGDHRDDLSADSKDRLISNPLRILDSKSKTDRRIVMAAPEFDESLDQESSDFFAEVCAGLDLLGISWRRNSRLVRGLDYYCHTAFEFTSDALGSQSTVLAGGRYDSLVEQMGGPSTAGVGWASGIERLSMLMGDGPAKIRPIAIIPLGDASEKIGLKLTERLRRLGMTVDLGYRGKIKQRMKRANIIDARVAVIIGDNELDQSSVTVKDLDSGEQELVLLDDLETCLENFFK